MASHHPIRKVVEAVIPDKLYFRIGDVAKLCDVPAYVLRFWETEFPQLKPNKGGTGQRLYRRRDVEMALRIKTLLYDEGYTIPGARQALKADKTDAKPKPATERRDIAFPIPAVANDVAEMTSANTDALRALRRDLQSLAEMLSQPASSQPKPRAKVQTMRPRGSQDQAPEKSATQGTAQQDLF